MNLNEVLEHMGNRGAVRRESWLPTHVLVFGMDNVGWLYNCVPLPVNNLPMKQLWIPCLAEILADDWEIVDLNWWDDREKFDGPVNYVGLENG